MNAKHLDTTSAHRRERQSLPSPPSSLQTLRSRMPRNRAPLAVAFVLCAAACAAVLLTRPGAAAGEPSSAAQRFGQPGPSGTALIAPSGTALIAYRPEQTKGGKVIDIIQIPGNTLLDPGKEKVVKTDAEWRRILTPEAYQITRQKGTEPAFTGAYEHNKKAGWYVCVACGNPLFTSDTKFDSGTGWPSFWAPLSPKAVLTEVDRTLGMMRTEVECGRCGAHLGHVFEDGPQPTGLRYCMNSGALRFIAKK